MNALFLEKNFLRYSFSPLKSLKRLIYSLTRFCQLLNVNSKTHSQHLNILLQNNICWPVPLDLNVVLK